GSRSEARSGTCRRLRGLQQSRKPGPSWTVMRRQIFGPWASPLHSPCPLAVLAGRPSESDDRSRPDAMTPHEAFLQAICETPDDDAPRLVYADWLMERDDPALVARGEFIRVQCELARLDARDRRREALEVEEKELLDEFGAEWLRAVHPVLET